MPIGTRALASWLRNVTSSGPRMEAISSNWWIDAVQEAIYDVQYFSAFINFTGTVDTWHLPSVVLEFLGIQLLSIKFFQCFHRLIFSEFLLSSAHPCKAAIALNNPDFYFQSWLTWAITGFSFSSLSSGCSLKASASILCLFFCTFFWLSQLD